MNQSKDHCRLLAYALATVLTATPLLTTSAPAWAQSTKEALEPLEPLEDSDDAAVETPKTGGAETGTKQRNAANPDNANVAAPDNETQPKENTGGGLILTLESDEDEENKPPAAPADSSVIRTPQNQQPRESTSEQSQQASEKTPAAGEKPVVDKPATAPVAVEKTASEAKPQPEVAKKPQVDAQPTPPKQAPRESAKPKVDTSKKTIRNDMPSDDDSLWVIIAGAGAGVAILAVVLFFAFRSPGKSKVADQPKAKPAARPAPAASAQAPVQAPARGRTVAILRDLSRTTDLEEHQLVSDIVQIGRAEAASPEIQSVVVHMSTVGRRHAVIEYRQHAYWLADQGSLNGTYLNGERMTSESLLHHGSRIQLESAEFEFVVPGAPDLGATMVADPDEFIETMVANADDAAKAMAASQAPANVQTPAQTAEGTVVEQPRVAGAQSTPGGETVDGATGTAVADEAPPSSATEMVDFDIFGGADAEEVADSSSNASADTGDNKPA